MASHPAGKVSPDLDSMRPDVEGSPDWDRDLVEHSQNLLCVHNLEGRFLSVNTVAARSLGYSIEEMLRMPMRDFLDRNTPLSSRLIWRRSGGRARFTVFWQY